MPGLTFESLLEQPDPAPASAGAFFLPYVPILIQYYP